LQVALAALLFTAAELRAGAPPSEAPTAQVAQSTPAEALASAKKLVDLAESQHGPKARELVDPLIGLATAQHRVKDDIGAARNYRRVVSLAETYEGANSQDLITALAGLGAVYAENGDYDASVQSLRRGIDLSRKLDGLLNPQQLDMMYSLIANYLALGDYESVGREQQMALQIATSAFGNDIPRLVGELERNANWFESMGLYATARKLHVRTLQVASNSSNDQDLLMVEPLRGIARDHRLEFLYGMENPFSDASGSSKRARPNREGESALLQVLRIIEAHPDSPAQERAKALVDLGDWNMLAGYAERALEVYREAWGAFEGDRGIFDVPAQIYYRQPGGTTPPTFGDRYVGQFVEVEFTVGADGSVDGVTLIESGVPDKTSRQLVKAVKGARYRPRFVNGTPVATGGVRQREIFYLPKS
jgi:tetratricopeptide (TPR) repeat protein